MTTPDYMTWGDVCDPALPDHATEVMSGHGGQPSEQVQNLTHGAASPASDNGPDPGSVVG